MPKSKGPCETVIRLCKPKIFAPRSSTLGGNDTSRTLSEHLPDGSTGGRTANDAIASPTQHQKNLSEPTTQPLTENCNPLGVSQTSGASY